MTRLNFAMAGLTAGAVLAALPAFSKPATPPALRPPPRMCCHVPAGTMVEISLAEEVGTKLQKTGDRFAFTLDAPLVVEGREVLRAGTPGVGEVVSASRPGMGGKPAKMVLAVRYLDDHRIHIPLQGLQLAAAGKDKSLEANAVGLSGIAFGPLGFIGLAVPGGNVDFPAGTSATAEVAGDINLPSLGPAPRGMADAAVGFDTTGIDTGSIAIPPPPRGMGEVVFFRAKSLMGTGQWFNVRENGDALGKLSNGAYFVNVTDTGAHTYTATTEPEAKDKLMLEVDPGQIYFVEGTLDKGLAIGVPDLTPSDRASFDKAAKNLKLAPPPTPDAPEDLSKYPDANSATNDAQ